MILFYVRHGDPIYDPDSLTPLGKRQAEALGHRLATYGIDKIFASTSNRAIETAQPTCELLKKKPTLLEFAHEKYAGEYMGYPDERKGEGKSHWVWHETWIGNELLVKKEVRELGHKWYEHPYFKDYPFKKGLDRAAHDIDEWFASLGYEHDRENGRYNITSPNPNERIALFAHEGFGKLFLSHVLDIPLPYLVPNIELQHSGLTVILFRDLGGYAIPHILTLSNDSHLYRDGLPLRYNNEIRF